MKPDPAPRERISVALFGAAGYTGLELAKLLARHPRVRLACAASDTHAGRAVDGADRPARAAASRSSTDRGARRRPRLRRRAARRAARAGARARAAAARGRPARDRSVARVPRRRPTPSTA